MSDGRRDGRDERTGTQVPGDGASAVVPDDDVTADVPADDPFTGEELGLALRARILVEYVTFGYGVHHLLRVVVLQFAVLFLDVGLLEFVGNRVTPDRRWLATATLLAATVAFLVILVVLVWRMGQRSLGPRFHRPVHLAGSVCGYVVASGLSFGFGYATLGYPAGAGDAASAAGLLSSTLVVLVFATFIAIGYHRQVDATDHPRVDDVSRTVRGWLGALSWPDHEPNSLERERTYEAFLRRTDEVATLLADARTVEGRRLAAEFDAWREQFEAHATLSQERVVRGSDDGALESERLAAEHEAFVSLRRRLAAVAGVDDEHPG